MKAKRKSVIPSEVMKKRKLLITSTSFGNLPEECVMGVLEFLEPMIWTPLPCVQLVYVLSCMPVSLP
jgi:hypothetical protein